jgi:hypothetical protein
VGRGGFAGAAHPRKEHDMTTDRDITERLRDADEVLRQLDDSTNQTWVGKRKQWARFVRRQIADIDALRAEVAALQADIPEGCTPADARILRQANHELAAEVEREREARQDAQRRVEALQAENSMAWSSVETSAHAVIQQRERAERAEAEAAALRLNEHQQRWVDNRAAILGAIERADLMLVNNVNGWELVKRPGRIDAARAREAAMSDAHMPRRAFRLTLVLEADTREGLADELHRFGERVELDDVTVGVTVEPSAGAIYELLHDPTMTHQRYFAQVRERLQAEREATR